MTNKNLPIISYESKNRVTPSEGVIVFNGDSSEVHVGTSDDLYQFDSGNRNSLRMNSLLSERPYWTAETDVPSIADHYSETAGAYFSSSLTRPGIFVEKRRNIDISLDDGDLAEIGAIFVRAMKKGVTRGSQDATRSVNKTSQSAVAGLQNELTLENTMAEPSLAQNYSTRSAMTVSAHALGVLVVILFSALGAASWASNIYFVHPVIVIAFVITGLTYAAIGFFSRAE